MSTSCITCRIVVPCHVPKGSEWPVALAPFGVKTPGRLQFKGKPVGEYSDAAEDFIGIVSPAEFQPEPPLEYATGGNIVRFVAVTVDGPEVDLDDRGKLHFVSPSSPYRAFEVEN